MGFGSLAVPAVPVLKKALSQNAQCALTEQFWAAYLEAILFACPSAQFW